jgi:hypothetical protein
MASMSDDVAEFENYGPDTSPLVGTLTLSGWRPPDRELSYGEWAIEGRRLRACHHGVLWGVGDWLNHGEHVYGETYVQAAEETGYGYGFLRVVKYVANRFPPEMRQTMLSFSHHREAATLDAETAQAFLKLAHANGWTQRDLKDAISVAKGDEKKPRRPFREPVKQSSGLEAVATEATSLGDAALDVVVQLCQSLQVHLKRNPAGQSFWSR